MSTKAPGLECQEIHVDPSYAKASQNDENTVQAAIFSDVQDDEKTEQFNYQHGRRYHAVDKETYSLPNDAEEAHRLVIQDLTWKLTMKGGLHLAPISQDIQRCVDMGTGTGLWAIDFANAHPHCEVVGTDLSAIKPKEQVPLNCSFIAANFNDEWNFSEPIDLIHGRQLSLGVQSWKRFFEQAFAHLIPGGWLDLQEGCFPYGYIDDGNVSHDSPLLMFSKYAIEATAKAGTDLTIAQRFREMAIAQGFVNVRYEQVKWPLDPWAAGTSEVKQIGALTGRNMREFFLEALAAKTFPTMLGWSEQQVHDFVAEIRKELEDPNKHYYVVMVFCCAQKPIK